MGRNSRTGNNVFRIWTCIWIGTPSSEPGSEKCRLLTIFETCSFYRPHQAGNLENCDNMCDYFVSLMCAPSTVVIANFFQNTCT